MRRAASVAWRAAHLPSALRTPSTALRPPIAAARNFSSTPAPSFFFRKPAKSVGELGQELLDARAKDRPDVLSKLYPAYVDAYKQQSTSPSSSSSGWGSGNKQARPPLSHAELESLLRYAASTGRFHLALKLFNDLAAVFALTPSPLDHHNLVMAMCRSGRTNKAKQWLEDMPGTFGLRAHVSDWNVLLGAYRRQRDLPAMARVVDDMRASGVEPNVVSYNTFISALFDAGKLDEVRRLVGEMRDRGVEGDLSTETALLTGFLDAAELGSAREVFARLSRAVDAALAKGKHAAFDDTAAVNALIKFEAADKGFRAGMRLAEKYRDVGVALNQRSLHTLVSEGAKTVGSAEQGVQLIEEVERLAGRDAGAERHAWSAVIRALAREGGGGVDEARRLYQLARDRSVQPDSKMVQPLLSALLSPSAGGVLEENLSAAKELYDDLSTSSRAFSTAPDASIYTTLLRACADPAHPDLAWSRALVADMITRGIRLEGAAVVFHIVALMRAAETWDEAFASYDTIRALDPTVLDLGSYNAILSGFTSLSPPSSGGEPAPAPLVQEFLSDMRVSQHPPNSHTYALLLTYYSRAPGATPATIAHLHSLIKLDVHLDPDTALFNALMAAYSHTRAWAAAYRVWDSIVANSAGGRGVQLDERTLSIFLDTCGYDGSPEARRRGRAVWADLEAGRLPLQRNRKNWETWLECLARWDGWKAWYEVEEIVFERMSGKEPGVPRATVETAQTILKMARRDGQDRVERIAERLRSNRLDLYEQVRELALLPRWEAGQKPPGEAAKAADGEA
ncbi:hypothetical protein JCM10213_000711 [Rhodosporidiobolus nylandii]